MNLIHGCVAGSRAPCSARRSTRRFHGKQHIRGATRTTLRAYTHHHFHTGRRTGSPLQPELRPPSPNVRDDAASRRRRRTPQVIMKLSTILALALSIGVVDSFASVDPVDPVDPVPPCEGGYIAASSQCPGAPEEGPSGICSGVRCPGPEDKFGLCTAITCTTDTYCCSDITFGVCQPRTPC